MTYIHVLNKLQTITVSHIHALYFFLLLSLLSVLFQENRNFGFGPILSLSCVGVNICFIKFYIHVYVVFVTICYYDSIKDIIKPNLKPKTVFLLIPEIRLCLWPRQYNVWKIAVGKIHKCLKNKIFMQW